MERPRTSASSSNGTERNYLLGAQTSKEIPAAEFAYSEELRKCRTIMVGFISNLAPRRRSPDRPFAPDHRQAGEREAKTLSFVTTRLRLSLRKRFLYARVHPPIQKPSPPRHPASYHRWRARARSVSLFFLIYNIITLINTPYPPRGPEVGKKKKERQFVHRRCGDGG